MEDSFLMAWEVSTGAPVFCQLASTPNVVKPPDTQVYKRCLTKQNSVLDQ